MTLTSYFLFILIIVGFWLYLVRTEPSPLSPKRYHGKVTYIFDGDTLQISGTKARIRLWGVDAPELEQRGSQQAKNLVTVLSKNKNVSYIAIDNDRYGRIVARVFLSDGRELNKLLIEQGVAKEYCRYSKGFYGRCR